MHAKYWLIGFALCIASIGGAAATTSADNQELDNASHASADNGSQHDNTVGNSGDTLGVAHETSQRSAGGDNAAPATATSSEHSGGDSSVPAHNHQPQLGWQSLLPGSIQ